MRGPLGGSATWHAVIAAAGGRCECGGQCGRKHTRRGGPPACPAEHTESGPLSAVPRADVPLPRAAALPPAELCALCEPCAEGTERGRARARRKAATDALAAYLVPMC